LVWLLFWACFVQQEDHPVFIFGVELEKKSTYIFICNVHTFQAQFPTDKWMINGANKFDFERKLNPNISGTPQMNQNSQRVFHVVIARLFKG